MATFITRFSTTRVGQSIRSFLRHSSVGRKIIRILSGSINREYEEHFHSAIIGSIRQGDIAWDIGANVGLYSRIFLEGVGPSGRVVAVEPSPRSATACREVGTDGRLTVIEAAVGDRDDSVQMAMDGETAVTNRVVNSGGSHVVRLVTCDTLLRELGMPPSIVKIDVEGFEISVLNGMRQVLRSPALRALFIEVHFGLLKQNGITDAPQRIAQMLQPLGFGVEWVDPSHVVARRVQRA
jgi:FkbM family methyltransferase